MVKNKQTVFMSASDFNIYIFLLFYWHQVGCDRLLLPDGGSNVPVSSLLSMMKQ